MPEEQGGTDQRIPRHVSVVMDGNGRWAKQRHLPRVEGHRRGLESVRTAVRGCGEAGVEALTLFAFSSENWRRPASEVRALMGLFRWVLEREVEALRENGIRLRVIGDRQGLGDNLIPLIERAEATTAEGTRMTLNIAANYGGRWDIAQATQQLAREAAEGSLDPADIGEEAIRSRLALADLPEPDLFIRTGGEQRISNFLVWQLAYTELYFTPTLWPDFDEEALQAAFESFSKRQRRFGRTGEQANALTGH
ncbi:Undecaprenyl pyrophosphate synthetase [Thiohalorhabdus denitrificans]|uniref:Ditrans,polycis-undecaprenyl-diphosphate synthase ((2E,6E)-farnesyl-diphosphate specific) n=2 Tax=Thiohalorhabdus denitrificans TaxID=381306 RepID=A0A1G5GT04_9GAMM|nr:polyprenyl diphosphate synthase [Thiohalorhabdus denitrificans]SCY54479.1 Undecaprenyl pyrophosphate synthetase [Thiohalorhabdus denitrificans]